MNKKIFLILFCMLFLFGIMFSVQAKTFEQNSNVDLKISTNQSSCDLTIVRQKDSTNLIFEEPMTINSGFANYTLGTLSNLGTYEYFSQCGSGSFKVTATGEEQSIAQGINSFGYIIIFLFLTLIIGIIGFKLTESEYLWVMGIFFLILALLLSIYDFWIGFEFHKNLSGIYDGSQMPEVIFSIYTLLVGMGLLSSIIFLIKNWKKLKKFFKDAKEDTERESEEDEREWE